MPWKALLVAGTVVALAATTSLLSSTEGPSAPGVLIDPAIETAVSVNRSDASTDDTIIFEEQLYPYEQFAEDETVSRIAYETESAPSHVSLEAAEDDVRFLFSMFKYGYALYQAFGGDAQFERSRDRVIAALPDIAGTDGMVRVSELRDLILENLGFIQDGHATFGGQRLYTRYDWFSNVRYRFWKDEGGYYTMTHSTTLLGIFPITWRGSKRYLLSVDGQPPENALALSLTERGELVYILSRIEANTAKRVRVEIVLAGESEDEVLGVWLRRDRSEVLPEIDLEPFYTETPYRRDTRNGISVIVHRSSVPAPAADEKALEQFVADAASLRDEDVVILDLRHHQGGQREYPLRWTQAYMDGSFSFENQWAELTTRTSLRLHRVFAEQYYEGNPEMLAAIQPYFDETLAYLDAHPEAVSDAWVLGGSSAERSGLWPNGTTLFVLMDERTGSAGEEFISMLRSYENVVFVGENTKGLMVSGSPSLGTLPHSQLEFCLPIEIFPAKVQEGLEGVGYSPDVWVEPGQALVRLLRYLSNRSG